MKKNLWCTLLLGLGAAAPFQEGRAFRLEAKSPDGDEIEATSLRAPSPMPEVVAHEGKEVALQDLKKAILAILEESELPEIGEWRTLLRAQLQKCRALAGDVETKKIAFETILQHQGDAPSEKHERLRAWVQEMMETNA